MKSQRYMVKMSYAYSNDSHYRPRFMVLKVYQTFDNLFFADHESLGCGKSFASAVEAMKNLLADHGFRLNYANLMPE